MDQSWIWSWKAPHAAEFKNFTIAFAVQQYVQNQVDQVLKELEIEEWSGWFREDLTNSTTAQQDECKQQLEQQYPGMIPGPYAETMERRRWSLIYILHADIPHDQLTHSPYNTDLKLCIVLWHHLSDGVGLTFFNNHIDKDTRFGHFFVDGATTSRGRDFAVGERGQGFILATQYLFEKIFKKIERVKGARRPRQDPELGISLRVGHQVGKLAWNEKSQWDVDQLEVAMEDLTPLSLDVFLQQQKSGRAPLDFDGAVVASDQEDTTEAHGNISSPSPRARSTRPKGDRKKAFKSLAEIYNRRIRYLIAAPRKEPLAEFCDPGRELSFVRNDGVAITILGLPVDPIPSALFSGTYGMLPMRESWRIPDTPIEFFKPAQDSPVGFYLRNQLVPLGPSLKFLGINYHGVLNTSTDRFTIFTEGEDWQRYQTFLDIATHRAFRPDFARLAVEIAKELLSAEHTNGTSLSQTLKPLNNHYGEHYRKAFDHAWRSLDKDLAKDKPLFPYPSSSTQATEDLELIRELGMEGKPVEEHVMRILKDSGAFPRSIEEQAGLTLQNAEVYTNEIAGLSLLRQALRSLFVDVTDDDIQIRRYRHPRPRAIYNPTMRSFSFRVPGYCDVQHDHHDEWLCWESSSHALSWAYIACLKTLTDQRDSTSHSTLRGTSSTRSRRDVQRSVADENTDVDRSMSSSPTVGDQISSAFRLGPSPIQTLSPTTNLHSPVREPALPPQQISTPQPGKTSLLQVPTETSLEATAPKSEESWFDHLEASIHAAKVIHIREQRRAKSLQEHFDRSRVAIAAEQEFTNAMQVDLIDARQEKSRLEKEEKNARKTESEQELKRKLLEAEIHRLRAKVERFEMKRKRASEALNMLNSDSEGRLDETEAGQRAAKRPKV
ncbi:MAG: hypothetical protein M1816_007625 [Peltula sp. TS41687]|nr:MAG: hypothetical protein M1816_007625 [Peltula sp. TS41687]